MEMKSRAILTELIKHGHKFKGYTVQEAKEALQDALDSDVIHCVDCGNKDDGCPYEETKVTPDGFCRFAVEKRG